MKNAIILIICIAILLILGGCESANEALPAISSPNEIIPFASKEESRQNACNTLKSRAAKDKLQEGIVEICDANYNNINADDEEKVDKLFSVFRELDSEKVDDNTKLIAGILLVSSLPSEPLPIEEALPVGEENFRNKLRDVVQDIKKNCPAEGYNSWIFTIDCSIHDFVQNKLYSDSYFESGGPCAYAETAKWEGWHGNNEIWTYVQSTSEGNGSPKTVKIIEIACIISCGSNNCPRHDIGEERAQEMLEEQCKYRNWNIETQKSDCYLYDCDYATLPGPYDKDYKMKSCCCSCKETEEEYVGRKLFANETNEPRLIDRLIENTTSKLIESSSTKCNTTKGIRIQSIISSIKNMPMKDAANTVILLGPQVLAIDTTSLLNLITESRKNGRKIVSEIESAKIAVEVPTSDSTTHILGGSILGLDRVTENQLEKIDIIVERVDAVRNRVRLKANKISGNKTEQGKIISIQKGKTESLEEITTPLGKASIIGYVRDIFSSSSAPIPPDPFTSYSNKVTWEAPLKDGVWTAYTKDSASNFYFIPKSERAHFIAKGALPFPIKFAAYDQNKAEEVANELFNVEEFCSEKEVRCSATLDTNLLDDGYYFVVVIDKNEKISNSLPIKIGNPVESSSQVAKIEASLKFVSPISIPNTNPILETNDQLISAAKSGQNLVLVDDKIAPSLKEACGNFLSAQYDKTKMVNFLQSPNSAQCPINMGDVPPFVLIGEEIKTEEECPSNLASVSDQAVSDYIPKFKYLDFLSIEPIERQPMLKVGYSIVRNINYEQLEKEGIEFYRDELDEIIIGVGESGMKTRFSNLATAEKGISYQWYFGDGKKSSDAEPEHIYKEPGEYLVSVMATDSEGRTAKQSARAVIKKSYGAVQPLIDLFGYIMIRINGKEGIVETGEYTGSFYKANTKDKIKITSGNGYIWASTDPSIATVDPTGVVTFSERMKDGDIVGIIRKGQSGNQDITYLQFSKKEIPRGSVHLVMETDAKSVSFITTESELNNTFIEANEYLSRPDIEEELSEFEIDRLKDILGHLLKLKGWDNAYEIIRKIYEGGTTAKGISDERCKCLEALLEYFRSINDADATLNFYNFCMCIYGYAGDSAVSFIGDFVCKWKMGDVPNPQNMPSATRDSWIEYLENTINECKNPGYIERKENECKKTIKDCEDAKKLVEEAKKKAIEAKESADEAIKHATLAQSARQRAEEALKRSFEAHGRGDIEGAREAAIEAKEAAMDAERAANSAKEKEEDTRNKINEARGLLDQAKKLCQGKCPKRDNSGEVFSLINEVSSILWSIPLFENSYRETSEAAGYAGLIERNAISIENAMKKSSCEKALALAQAALDAAMESAKMVDSISQLEKSALSELDELSKIEEETVRIRKEERYHKTEKLEEQLKAAEKITEGISKKLDDAKIIRDRFIKITDDILKLVEDALKASQMGDSEDPNCKKANELASQAKETVDRLKSDIDQIIKNLEGHLAKAQEHVKNIKSIIEEWDDKRRTIKSCTYKSPDGSVIIWAGNGDAEPPPGADCHGKWKGGKWIEGGPPAI